MLRLKLFISKLIKIFKSAKPSNILDEIVLENSCKIGSDG